MAVHTHTIKTPVFVFVLSSAIFLDAIKFILFFVQVFPIIGTGIDVIVDEIIGFIEDMLIGVLGFAGGFTDKMFITTITSMIGNAVINAIPEVDTFPSTTITVIFIFWRSRVADKKRYLAAVKTEEAAARAQAEQAIREQRAQEVAERMLAQRTQFEAA